MSQEQNILPTDAATILLLADDVREEIGGKVTLMGYMPGRNFKLGPKPSNETQQEALQSLAMLMIFQDGIGEFKLGVSLVSPDGQEQMKDYKSQIVRKLPDGALNITLVMKPFPAKVGTYNLTVSLNEASYKRSFTMSRAADA